MKEIHFCILCQIFKKVFSKLTSKALIEISIVLFKSNCPLKIKKQNHCSYVPNVFSTFIPIEKTIVTRATNRKIKIECWLGIQIYFPLNTTICNIQYEILYNT